MCQDLQSQQQAHPKYSWDGTLFRRKAKVVVGSNPTLRKTLFDLFQGRVIGGHSGAQATRHRLASIVYWKGLSKDVQRWTRECIVYQRCKRDTSAYPGLLQPFPIPTRACSNISMDFIKGLPVSKGKITIFVEVDRLTKYGHFMVLHHHFTVALVALEYLQYVYKLLGAPEYIVSDTDKCF